MHYYPSMSGSIDSNFSCEVLAHKFFLRLMNMNIICVLYWSILTVLTLGIYLEWDTSLFVERSETLKQFAKKSFYLFVVLTLILLRLVYYESFSIIV